MNQPADQRIDLSSATGKRQSGTIRAARRRRMTLAWSVWFMAALFVFFQFYIQLSSGQIVGALMHSFSLTTFGGGLLASMYYYVYTLLQAPAGMLMDRYGPRLILSIGAVVVSVGCVVFSTASSVVVAAFGRMLMGAGAAFAFVGCLNLISRWFPMRRFALMAAIVEGAGMLGAIVGSLWLADFIEHVGWRTCMLVSGIIAAVMAVFLWIVVRNAPKKRAPQVELRAVDLWLGVKRLLHNPIVWINGAYSGLMFSMLTVFVALWAIPFFQQAHHLSLFHATLTACSLYAGVIVGGPLMGWLDSRYPCRRFVMATSALFASMILFLVIFWLSMPIWALVAFLFLAGLLAGSYVLTFAVANELAIPTNRATSLGLANMLCVGFAPILQPVVGYLMHAFDGGIPNKIAKAASLMHFQWALSVIPFLLLIATVLAFFIPKRQRTFIKRK